MNKLFLLAILFTYSATVYGECVEFNFSRNLVDGVTVDTKDIVVICDDNTYEYLSPRHGGNGEWSDLLSLKIEFTGPLESWKLGVITDQGIEFDYTNNAGKEVFSRISPINRDKCNSWPLC